MTKSRAIRFLQYPVVFVIAVLVGLGLMLAATALPVEPIRQHVEQSAVTTINNDGPYPVLTDICTSKVEGFSDYWILLMAENNAPDTLLNRTLMMYYQMTGREHPGASLISHYVYGREYDAYYEYSRYWHGYMIFVKPLLLFCDYAAIRLINGIVQILVLFIVVALMYKRGLKELILPYFITYLLMMPLVLMQCMFYSPCFYLTNLAVVILILFRGRKERLGLIFFVTGILLAYFDFLSFPFITFGIPFLVWLYMEYKDNGFKVCLPSFIKELIVSGIAWLMGYMLMWVTKWVITYIFSSKDAFKTALSVVSLRTGFDDGSSSGLSLRFSAIGMNWEAWWHTPVTIIFAAILIAELLAILFHKRSGRENAKKNGKEIAKVAAAFGLIALTPFAWYFCLSNHSTVHPWFANKTLAIFSFGLLIALTAIKQTMLYSSPEDDK